MVSKKTPTFRMKKKPTPPKRRSNSFNYIYSEHFREKMINSSGREYEIPLDWVMEWIEKENVKNVYIKRNSFGILGDILESESSFSKKVERYEKDVAEYNKWAEENKDAIEQYLKNKIEKQKTGVMNKVRAMKKLINNYEKKIKSEEDKMKKIIEEDQDLLEDFKIEIELSEESSKKQRSKILDLEI